MSNLLSSISDKQASICVVGLGYIGLPTAALLADCGYKVYGVDCQDSVVDTINKGEIHIHEPALAQYVSKAVQNKMLTAATNPTSADVFIIAVPTPFREGKKPDLKCVQTATYNIAPYLNPNSLIIIESTIPVGTTEQVATWIKDARPDLSIPSYKEENNTANNIYISHCPERVLPGKIIHELIHNDRIIGGINTKSAKLSAALYQELTKGDIYTADSRTAELAKLTENSFRDVNIAFANELSMICDKLDINVWQLIKLANRHPRVNILNPGPGVGGHCIAVDPWFIVDSVPDVAKLIHTARNVNDNKIEFTFRKIKQACQNITNPVIACLGLSFKADIDDLRESPALHIVEKLASYSSSPILVVEPHIKELPNNLGCHKHVFLSGLEEALNQADIVVLLVEHTCFKEIASHMLVDKITIDTRGIWE